MIAEIIIDILNKQVNRSFDYLIPKHLEQIIKVGYRVYVPFGSTRRVGFVIKIKKETEYKKKLKEIMDIIDVYPVLNDEFIDIAKYIAENNFSFYATALQTMIPSALKVKYQKIVRVVHFENLSIEAKGIMTHLEMNLDSFSKEKQEIIFKEVQKGNLILDTKIKKRKDERQIQYVILNDTDILPTSKQGKGLISYLEELGGKVEYSYLLEDSGYSKSVVQTLVKKGILSFISEEIPKISREFSQKDKNISLNSYQQKVVDTIQLNEYKTYLLHGVTGSGKTEVYMHLIEKVLFLRKTAILLVPEISLTPQITSLFEERFSSNVAILHSRLTPTEKYTAWRKIYHQEVSIVIGARSAIFAPIENLGILIIDEAHESSYIQQNNPKYHTIEIAKLRAKKYNIPVVLGSATPDVVDYYYATNGEYELLTLPKRVNGKPLPSCEVIDMRLELFKGNKSVFSYRLEEEIKKCYANKEQSILFLNRRGYSSFVMCRSCGEVVKCPHCDVSLTYHASTQTLKCHYCGYAAPNVTKCYHCGSDKIRFVGTGTEKIMEAVHNLLPEARVLRVDMDTTNRLEDYENAYSKFKNHEVDILVGTQMITKGLDFRDVTLVGVLNADLALDYPCYDATMVAYNLIEQVSGRAGRDLKDGKVILQTYQPKHYVIECAQKHDYESFYMAEIQNRRMTMMPPFSTMIEILVSSNQADLAFEEAKRIVDSLNHVKKESIILGPAEALIFKKRDQYRFTIQIKVVEDAVLEKIRYIYPLYQENKNVSISITRM